MFGDAWQPRLVRQSGNGRVTIPIEFRRALGIEGEPVLEMELVHGELHIRQVARAGAAPQCSKRSNGNGECARQPPDAHAGAWQDSGDGDALI